MKTGNKINSRIRNRFKIKGDKAVSKQEINNEELNNEELNNEELNNEELNNEEINNDEIDNEENDQAEAAPTEEAAEDDQESAPTEEAAGEETVEDKKKKKDSKDEKIEELQDKVKRQLAEFENFRNRTDKEKSQMYEMGAKSVIEKILPIIDNFERGLEHAPAEGDPFADGMRMVYKQMITELEGIGVKAIEAVGNDFDPNIHNAVMQVASEEYESGKVAQELQKGYMYRDTMVRPSMVAVVE